MNGLRVSYMYLDANNSVCTQRNEYCILAE